MSPTSCHCSTPRRHAVLVSFRDDAGRPQRPRLPWRHHHSTLRRCSGSRPGSGWVRVEPKRSRPRAPRIVSATNHCVQWGTLRPLRAHHEARHLTRNATNSALTIRTRQLQSVARCPPRAYRPGRLPGVSQGLSPLGCFVSGPDSRLDAFSGSPFRTSLPSDAGCPTTGSRAVRPSRSSRTRDGPPHTSNAHSG